MHVLRASAREGAVIVEFAVVSTVMIVAGLIGIFFAIHFTKSYALERGLHAAAEVVMLSGDEERFAAAAAVMERTYRFPRDAYAFFVYECQVGSTMTCVEVQEGRGGGKSVESLSSSIISRLNNAPVTLPVGERFFVVGALLADASADTARRLMGIQGDSTRLYLVVAPVAQ